MSESIPNTAEQIAAIKLQEQRAALEQSWPIFEVEIEGDEALWTSRAGVNLAKEDEQVTLKIEDEVVYKGTVKEGDPKPWVAKARATVSLHAKNSDMARARALNANTDYHTVLSVKEIKQ